VLELPVAPFRRHQRPAVGLEESNHLAHLHPTTLPQPRGKGLDRMQTITDPRIIVYVDNE